MSEPSHATPGRAGCPDPEQLAAHAEGSLKVAEAAWMDEHIAGCAACFDVYAETLRLHLEEPATLVEEPTLGRPSLWQRPIFKLAAILMVATGVFLSGTVLQRKRGDEPAMALVTPLARAMGARRFVEPRVTGGFQHARLVVLRSGDAPQGLDAQPPAVLAAVAQIRERAEADTSPETLGALAVTYLVSGDIGAAVKALESATAQAPDNARLWSDLAAAYLVRASRLDEPADIPKALEAAERAIALKDPPDEAWFNRALALESLRLDDAARKAWEDYLQRDSASGWADEARQHLEARPKVRQSTVEEDRARVKAALAEGPAAVDLLADEAPSLLRNYFDDDLLPAWAKAHLVGHPDESLHREHARLLGDALLRVTGDAMARDTAQALVTPPAPATAERGAASPDPLRAQAQGFAALKEAKRLYELQEPACEPFRVAAGDLAKGQSPYVAWVRQQVVAACFFSSDQAVAMAELERLEPVARQKSYVQLQGRVHWLEALLHGQSGEMTASLSRFDIARESFQKTGDGEGESAILVRRAEVLHLLGEGRGAWRERLRALQLFDDVRNPRRRHGMLSEILLACLDERMPRSALHFGTALLETARRWSRDASTAEALARRATIHHALGRDQLAAQDLQEARQLIARAPDAVYARRIAAEADAAEGEILMGQEPGRAAPLLGEALAYFRTTAPSRVPMIHLLLARAQVGRGLDDAAEAELRAGIESLERQRMSLRDAALQVSFLDQSLPLFDDMVRLQALRRRDPERALAFVERGRARQLLDSMKDSPGHEGATGTREFGSVPLDVQDLRRDLPEGLALVFYQSLEDRLLAWVLVQGGTHFVERPLTSSELSRLVAAYRAALEGQMPLASLHQASARLHDELVRPLHPFLVAQRALVVIADGVLQSVPFSSLWDREAGRYLVEDYLLEMAPSGTVFVRASQTATTSARGPMSRALVVGNPRVDRRVWTGMQDLPGAEAEAIEIAGLYPHAEMLTGSGATKAAFLHGMRNHQVVHFAGHAVSRSDAPSAARLVLAPDPRRGASGALSPSEVGQAGSGDTRLVVLAACRTAAGSVSRVEGALSLGRPFLAAGVPYVVASLWDIDDAVGRRFFVAFHRALLAGSEPPQALRKAQIALVRDPDASRAHPSSWGAFVSMGGLDRHSFLKGDV